MNAQELARRLFVELKRDGWREVTIDQLQAVAERADSPASLDDDSHSLLVALQRVCATKE